MITRTFKLCLNAGNGSAPYINVNQYDEGETWLFELYSENGERYIPSSGAIVGVKSDGHGIVNTGTVDSEGRVVITETQQMTASAGRAIYELSIDGLTHGTANFIVAVERKPTDDAVMSDSDLSLIQEAIDSAEVIVEVIGDGDPSEVIGEHVDAWLDNHPEATTTVEDGAITAPKINSTLWDKLLVSESASGNPASFDDGADDVPVSSLKVTLEPVQLGSGDPSPSNIRPISGQSTVTVDVVGKNLLKNNLEDGSTAGVTYTRNADGSISCVGTPTSTSSTRSIGGGAVYLANGEYILTGTASVIKVRVNLIDENGTVMERIPDNGSGVTFTVDDTVHHISVVCYASSLSAVNETIYPMIRQSYITDAEYEPYIGASYPYTLGQSVYGGTVDLATGVLTVDRVLATFNGSENWTKSSSAMNGFYLYTQPRNKFGCVLVSDRFIYTPTISVYFANYGYCHSDGAINLSIDPSIGGSTVADFKTWLSNNNVQVVYELNEPQTIQLTPTQVKTLLGYNNISSTGTVDVIYHADTKLYVDKMTAVDNNIIAPTEESFTATRNYTVNDLVIVNDTLYKVTANIASGSAITPNSNVQQTTLGALIKALS